MGELATPTDVRVSSFTFASTGTTSRARLLMWVCRFWVTPRNRGVLFGWPLKPERTTKQETGVNTLKRNHTHIHMVLIYESIYIYIYIHRLCICILL